jgi:hypothetical protein
LLCLLPARLQAADAADTDKSKTPAADSVPAPYDPEEFPLWARDLRRAEVVAFGSLPFALFFSKTAVDTVRYAQHDWDRAYAPWPLKAAGAVAMTEDEYKRSFAIACAGAISVALVDYIIVRIKRHSERRTVAERPKSTYTIERRPAAESPAEDSGTAEAPEGP